MRSKPKPTQNPQRKRPPAATPEAGENRMIALAVDPAEQQLAAGTASSQVITHFLKPASSKERIEKEILTEQKKLITAKTESIQSAKRVEELYINALNAMRTYTGCMGEDGEDVL